MPKILVIDDNSAQRETIQDALRSNGFETIEAENGTAGVEMARTHLPDLILCDVNMAQGDGYATLALLRNEPVTANIPFILMSGYSNEAGMRRGMQEGADDYLTKPFTMDALFTAVKAQIKSRRS